MTKAGLSSDDSTLGPHLAEMTDYIISFAAYLGMAPRLWQVKFNISRLYVSQRTRVDDMLPMNTNNNS